MNWKTLSSGVTLYRVETENQIKVLQCREESDYIIESTWAKRANGFSGGSDRSRMLGVKVAGQFHRVVLGPCLGFCPSPDFNGCIWGTRASDWLNYIMAFILFLTALLRYSLHIIQFSHLNVKLFSVYSQNGTMFPTSILAHFHYPQRNPTPLAVIPQFLPARFSPGQLLVYFWSL